MKMSHQLISAFFAIWLTLGLVSCVSLQHQPETPLETLTSIEIGYQEVLKTATVWRAEGRLSDSDIQRFNDAFDQYETYRNAARAALLIGDDLAADKAVSQTTGALTALRQLLTEYE